ncbi:uncharacterized protein [Triticum aestivum]|uniref:uncharacterized protein isoform X1 n=1 Tax=Triticum aestivum TaxID=4565 RepID=UPI001D013A7B|nr:uncharacterized protein LOC123043734 isoform X1 [Triticum aestivum]
MARGPPPDLFCPRSNPSTKSNPRSSSTAAVAAPTPMPLATPSLLADLCNPIGIYGGSAWISASPPSRRIWCARSKSPPSLRHHHQNCSTPPVASLSSTRRRAWVDSPHGFLPANGDAVPPLHYARTTRSLDLSWWKLDEVLLGKGLETGSSSGWFVGGFSSAHDLQMVQPVLASSNLEAHSRPVGHISLRYNKKIAVNLMGVSLLMPPNLCDEKMCRLCV